MEKENNFKTERPNETKIKAQDGFKANTPTGFNTENQNAFNTENPDTFNAGNQESFRMTYAANQQAEIEKIRKKYLPREEREDKMEKLRELDARAGKTAMIYAVTIGIIGALLMGTGMSLVMSDFGKWLGTAALPVGIVTGVIGIALVVLAYPVYNHTLKKEQEKIAPQILQLTDELMK